MACRLRLIEENLFAPTLDSSTPVDPEWRRKISADLRNPALRISVPEAIQHRLRRIYLPLLTVLWVAWIARITAFARADLTFLESARIGSIPGRVSVTGVALCTLAVLLVGFWPGTRKARGKMTDRSSADRFWTH